MAEIISIVSANNEKFKMLKHLLVGATLKKEQFFLWAGKKLVQEYCARPQGRFRLQAVVTSNKLKSVFEVDEKLSKVSRTASIWELSGELFSQIDRLQTHYPILLFEQIPLDLVDLSQLDPVGCEVILPLSDPANLGSALRSCAGFGVQRAWLTSEASNPYHYRAVKAASGALELVALAYTQSISDLLRCRGPLVVLDKDGVDLRTARIPRDFRLLVGQEGKGIPKSWRTEGDLYKLKIPMSVGLESLSAPTCVAIALYELQKVSLF